jgi:1-acyl-sn-glycerol-3-phosphate acyltransferase
VEPLPDDVQWSQPHIFIMNHQSMVDIPCVFTALPANIRFVAKHTLKYFPFLGWYMWATGMIFINRSNRREAVASLALAGERIRAGANILAFPEGTRSRDGRVLPFKKGPFALAVEAQVSIIPVAIHGTHKVLPRGGLKYRPNEVRLKVGKPIPTAGLKAAQRDALIHEVRQALARLHADIGGPGAVAEDIAAVGVEGLAAK